MIQVKKEGVILSKSSAIFENEGVMNPAIIMEAGIIHMFYRAVSSGNHSTIGYCKLSDPLTVVDRFDFPVIVPEYEYESHGVEDPRIVKIEDAFYLTYTAYDGYSAMGVLAVSQDLKSFSKMGLIVPQVNYKDFKKLVLQNGEVSRKYFRFDQSSLILWDKNVIFFPRKINKKFVFLHRIRPGIQIVSINTLEDLNSTFWNDYFLNFSDNIVLDPKSEHETSYIGGGCPPIETPQGWLLIYHSVRDTIDGFIYSASAALLDLENPQIEIARLPYPLFEPTEEYEKAGEVNNVCFPTGTVVIADRIYIYYGAADEKIACASVEMSNLIGELLKYKK